MTGDAETVWAAYTGGTALSPASFRCALGDYVADGAHLPDGTHPAWADIIGMTGQQCADLVEQLVPTEPQINLVRLFNGFQRGDVPAAQVREALASLP